VIVYEGELMNICPSKLKKVICILFVAVFAYAVSGCNSNSEDYVLTIDGEKISRGEFMVYLMEQKKSFEQQGGDDIWGADFDGVSAEEVAKQNAANSIQMVKTALKQIKPLGIDADDIDSAAIEEDAQTLYDEVSNYLGEDKLKEFKIDKKLVNKIITEGYLQTKVFDYVTSGYRVSESDFEAYAEDYYNKIKAKSSTYTVKEIYIPADVDNSLTNADKIEQAWEKLKSGADFDEVVKEYSQGDKTQSYKLDNSLLSDEALQKLYETKVGETTLVEEPYAYYIFKVEKVDTPPVTEEKDEIKSEYIKDKKQEIYQTQNDKWNAEITGEKNNELWNDISVNP
jgi:parvulin-like peptidyl-prolyl isomerase